MRKYMFSAVLLVAAVMAIPAHANYICSGTISYLGMANDGNVVLAGPGGIPTAVLLCNLNNSTSNGFSPAACKAAYATLLANRLSGQPVSIYFNDSLTCSTQPTWSNPVSAYFVSNP